MSAGGGTLSRGGARRLTIYLNESSRWHGRPLYEAILEVLLSKGLAGATVVRAVAGFTREKGIVTAAILDLSVDLPLKIEVVDTAGQIDEVLPDLHLMLDRGLMTVDDVTVVKFTGESAPAPAAADEPPRRITMKAKQLSVHLSEKDLYHGEPLFEAILKRFSLEEFAGATVHRAVEGFGAHHTIHRDRLRNLHREAPMVLYMVDSEENVMKARRILDGMLTHGAVVVSDVEVTFYGPSAENKSPGETSKPEPA